MSAYTVGPTLTDEQVPWPCGWEQDPKIDDGHSHQWEAVLLLPGPCRPVGDEVVRCGTCLAPRCGSVHDYDPCIERRHHSACHRYASGRREHVGGLARSCRCGRGDTP